MKTNAKERAVRSLDALIEHMEANKTRGLSRRVSPRSRREATMKKSSEAMAVRYLDALIKHMEADETRGLPPTLAALPWAARSEILCSVEDLLYNYDDDEMFEAAQERLIQALAAAVEGD